MIMVGVAGDTVGTVAIGTIPMDTVVMMFTDVAIPTTSITTHLGIEKEKEKQNGSTRTTLLETQIFFAISPILELSQHHADR
jgi:Na+-driven multidrug efflux pump